MITESDGKEKRVKEKVYFKHVNLYDIPRGIVPEQVYDMAEAMREENLQEWKHVIMGEVGDPATMVFSSLKPMREQDVSWEAKENWILASPNNWRWFCGIDYGYSPDPTAGILCAYNKIAKILWIVDECYGTRWSEEAIAFNVKEMLSRAGNDIGKRLSAKTVVTPSMIINSEIDNRIIDSLRTAGLNIYPIKKFSGSRDVSYQFLTGGYGDLKEIWIDSERCPSAWAEFSGAEFARRDINGKEIIVQEWPSYADHTIDRTVVMLLMTYGQVVQSQDQKEHYYDIDTNLILCYNYTKDRLRVSSFVFFIIKGGIIWHSKIKKRKKNIISIGKNINEVKKAK